jgi:hypothetical protein
LVVLSYYSCGESCLLISWCVGDRCDMAGGDKDLGRSRRSGAEDQGWSSTGQILGGWTIGRSGAVGTVHKETRSACYLVESQN